MHHLRWIFSLAALATLALIGLQAYIWRQGIQQERERFHRALTHAVYEATEEFMRPFESTITVINDDSSDALTVHRPGFVALQIGNIDSVEWLDPDQFIRETIHRELTIIANKKHSYIPDDSVGINIKLHTHSDSVLDWTSSIQSDSMKNRFFVDFSQRCPDCKTGYSQLSSTNFKPLLEQELTRLGIAASFQWGVSHLDNWLIVDGDTSRLEASEWRVPFFSFRTDSQEPLLTNAISAASPHLNPDPLPVIVLFFPGEHWHLIRSFGPTLLVSTLLACLVLGCIGFAVYVILRQKQLSEIKTDFINNMTHELKTPISTIALACEALTDKQIALTQDTRNKYLGMILAENDRLGGQVEKVLHMALIDNRDPGLKIEKVNVHHLLGEIIDAFSLQLKQRHGTITTDLQARHNIVAGDQMHLRQMFSNLLDNANKYSPDAPQIHIETTDTDSGIEIAIHDKGLGISREALRKIFDRFYRVPTGNRHDVKGFGLGLSYVQSMATAHGGRVYARSKPGMGSTFYLSLPKNNE